MRFAAVVVTVLSVVLVTRLKLSTDLTELFPRTVEAETLARVTHVFGGGDVAPVLVRGDDAAEVERAAHEAAVALRTCGSIAQVIEEMPAPAPKVGEAPDPTAAWRFAGPNARDELARAVTPEGMKKRLRDTRALLLAPGAGDVADKLARDPLRLTMIPWEGRVEIAAGARASGGGAFVAKEGRARLLVIEPRGRAFDSGAAARFTSEAEAAIDGVRRAHPNVVLALTGGHVIAKQTEAMMKGDLQKSGVLSGVLASLVFVADVPQAARAPRRAASARRGHAVDDRARRAHLSAPLGHRDGIRGRRRRRRRRHGRARLRALARGAARGTLAERSRGARAARDLEAHARRGSGGRSGIRVSRAQRHRGDAPARRALRVRRGAHGAWRSCSWCRRSARGSNAGRRRASCGCRSSRR